MNFSAQPIRYIYGIVLHINRLLLIITVVSCMEKKFFSFFNFSLFFLQALEFIAQNMKDFGIKRTKRLAVSGAFHTQLMQEGLQDFTYALKKVEFQPPAIPVYSNVKAGQYSNSREEFIKLLRKHLIKPVKWEQIMHVLYSRQKGEKFPHTYEVGPGKQLGTLLRLVNLKAFENYHKVDI